MTTVTETVAVTNEVQKDWPLPLLQSEMYLSGRKDDYTYCSSDMTTVHNMFIRGWNSIYQQAPVISDRDYADFIQYALTWHWVLDLHHDGEEKDLFPRFEREIGVPGFMSGSVDQHAAFHDGLEEFHRYLSSCAEKPESFQPRKLMEIMDSFGAALHTHMADEPKQILKLSEQKSFDIKGVMDAHVKHVLGKASAVQHYPILWANHDLSYEGGLWTAWPPIPKPVMFVFRNVLAQWHWRLWRFGATDLKGRNQQYLALRPEYGN